MRQSYRAWRHSLRRLDAAERRDLRERVLERDKHRCRCCGTERNLTLDHIIPASMGGPAAFHNLQTLCQDCNIAKGDRMVKF